MAFNHTFDQLPALAGHSPAPVHAARALQARSPSRNTRPRAPRPSHALRTRADWAHLRASALDGDARPAALASSAGARSRGTGTVRVALALEVMTPSMPTEEDINTLFSPPSPTTARQAGALRHARGRAGLRTRWARRGRRAPCSAHACFRLRDGGVRLSGGARPSCPSSFPIGVVRPFSRVAVSPSPFARRPVTRLDGPDTAVLDRLLAIPPHHAPALSAAVNASCSRGPCVTSEGSKARSGSRGGCRSSVPAASTLSTTTCHHIPTPPLPIHAVFPVRPVGGYT